jgi:hypothetical protein
MDSDRTPLEKGKDVLHGAARAAPLRQSVEQPWVDRQVGLREVDENYRKSILIPMGHIPCRLRRKSSP